MFPIRHLVGSYVGYFFRRLFTTYICIYYRLKCTQIIQLDEVYLALQNILTYAIFIIYIYIIRQSYCPDNSNYFLFEWYSRTRQQNILMTSAITSSFIIDSRYYLQEICPLWLTIVITHINMTPMHFYLFVCMLTCFCFYILLNFVNFYND